MGNKEIDYMVSNFLHGYIYSREINNIIADSIGGCRPGYTRAKSG